MRRFVSVLVVAGSLALAAGVLARGKSRECKPSGAPTSLGTSGGVAVAQPVQYLQQPWLLLADKSIKADKLRVVHPNGEIKELGKPPATVEPIVWLARGRAIYALAKGRSLTTGKTDVLLLRWVTDPRPRQTVLGSADSVIGAMSGVFVDEFLAVSWAEVKDGQPHRMLSFLDSEELRVNPAQDLGVDGGAAVRVQPQGKGFSVLWTSKQGVMRAGFDLRGKTLTPAAALEVAAPTSVRALAQCADRTWVVSLAGEELSLSSAGPSGPLAPAAKLASLADPDLVPVECVDDGVVLGRRTLQQGKDSSVIFWASTIDATGKVRERKVKETRGSADDVRMPQLAIDGNKLNSYWAEGQGVGAKVWARELSCD